MPKRKPAEKIQGIRKRQDDATENTEQGLFENAHFLYALLA